MLMGCLVCVICNSNNFHPFVFKLCIMIVYTLKMCTFYFVHISWIFFHFWGSFFVKIISGWQLCFLIHFKLWNSRESTQDGLKFPRLELNLSMSLGTFYQYLRFSSWNFFMLRQREPSRQAGLSIIINILHAGKSCMFFAVCCIFSIFSFPKFLSEIWSGCWTVLTFCRSWSGSKLFAKAFSRSHWHAKS